MVHNKLKKSKVKKLSSSLQAKLFLERNQDINPFSQNLTTNDPITRNECDGRNKLNLLSEGIDDNLRHIFKLIFKKSHDSKIKGLERLYEVIPIQSDIDILKIMPIWVKVYNSSMNVDDIGVKQLIQNIQLNIVQNQKITLREYVDSIIVTWLLACFDSEESISKIARQSLCLYFLDEKFQLNSPLLMPYAERISEFLVQKLQNVSSLNLKSIGPDYKHEPSVSGSIRLSFYILTLKDSSTFSTDPIIENLFHQKFLLMNSKSNEGLKLILRSFHDLINSEVLVPESCVKKILRFVMKFLQNYNGSLEYQTATSVLSVLRSKYKNIAFDKSNMDEVWLKIPMLFASASSIQLFQLFNLLDELYIFDFHLLSESFHKAILKDLLILCDKLRSSNTSQENIYLRSIRLHEKIITSLLSDVNDISKFEELSELEFETLLSCFGFDSALKYHNPEVFQIFTNILNIIFVKSEENCNYTYIKSIMQTIIDKLENSISKICSSSEAKIDEFFLEFFKILVKCESKLLDLVDFKTFVFSKFGDVCAIIDQPINSKVIIYYCVLGSFHLHYFPLDKSPEDILKKIASQIADDSNQLVLAFIYLIQQFRSISENFMDTCGDIDVGFLIKVALQLLKYDTICMKLGSDIMCHVLRKFIRNMGTYRAFIDDIAQIVINLISDHMDTIDELQELKKIVFEYLLHHKKSSCPQESHFFVKLVFQMLKSLDLSKFHTGSDFNVIVKSWLFKLIENHNYAIEALSSNISIIFRSLNGLIDDLYCLNIHPKKLYEFFFNFFKSQFIVNYFEHLENVTAFLIEMAFDYKHLVQVIDSSTTDPQYIHKSTSTLYIPTSITWLDEECDSLKHANLQNKLMVFYVLFDIPETAMIVENHLTKKTFMEWFVSFLFLTILFEDRSGILCMNKVLQRLPSDCLKNLTDELLNKCTENSYYCMLLDFLLKKMTRFTHEMCLTLLNDYLKNCNLNTLDNLNNIHIVNTISILMGSLKSPAHIILIIDEHLVKLSLINNPESVLFNIGFLRSLITSLLDLKQKSKKFIAACQSLWAYVQVTHDYLLERFDTVLRTKSLEIVHEINIYLCVSLIRMLINFNHQFSYSQLLKEDMMEILKKIPTLIPGLDCDSFYTIMIIEELVKLCLLVLYNIDNAKSLLNFSQLSISQLHPKNIQNVFHPSYTFICQEIVRKMKSLTAVSTLSNFCGLLSLEVYEEIGKIPLESSGCVLFRHIKETEIFERKNQETILDVVSGDYQTNKSDFTGLQSSHNYSLFIEREKIKDIKEAIGHYFDSFHRINMLETDILFIKKTNDGQITEIDSSLKHFIKSSIDAFTNQKGHKAFTSHKYHFFSHDIQVEFLESTIHLLNSHLFLQMLINVAEDNRWLVFTSSDVKSLVFAIISSCFSKLNLDYHYDEEIKQTCTVSGDFLEILTFQSLLWFGMEYPLLLNDAVSDMRRDLFKKTRNFCLKLLCKSIITKQMDNCEIYFKDDPSFIVSCQRELNVVSFRYSGTDDEVEFLIRITRNYPFEPIKIEPVSISKMSNEISDFIRAVEIFVITHKHSNLADALKFFRARFDESLGGIEKCHICFSVLSSTDLGVPSKKCIVCQKKFHKTCLVQWFVSSVKKSCPLCRSIFY
ncbi:E3 ubiquitin-protein ligase listerin [Thelohanellus kitauei]|uniref:E3 ubiquitin-protein ligase listerin n=1 Tax=Thelohanellus kitauei TaxID=669202 RepID=A0A0C2MQQ3_THEKT|nr:E3 ubiquitin-protein ligase listerin [Thelohanellus kitauei]